MKPLLLTLLLLQTLFAEGFSVHKLLGNWEVSSSKENSFVSFGKYVGKDRGESLELMFNNHGRVKVVKTGEVYAYEVKHSQLKIIELRRGYNNKLRETYHYDLFKIIGRVDGCYKVKVMKKRIMGLKSRHPLKMCKMAPYPIDERYKRSDYQF